MDTKIIKRAQDADAIIINKLEITEKILKSLPKLRHISIVATGFNNVELKSAKHHKVTVSNVQGYAKDCVPQHAFAMMLNFAVKLK